MVFWGFYSPKISILCVSESTIWPTVDSYLCQLEMKRMQLDTIETALDALRAGKVVIVVDDANRENEGDFIVAAEHITPDIINFMATHGRGLICTALTEDRCR